MVRDTGARLAVTLTGDRHHYARYEPTGEGADEVPTRITAGGGGAYLSATHTLPEQLELATLPRKDGDTYVAQPSVVNRREAIYPTDSDSRRLSNGILKLAALNPGFGRLLGALYALNGVALLGGIDANVDNAVNETNELIESAQGTGTIDVFFDTATNANYFHFLGNGFGAMSIVLAVCLFAAIFGAMDIKQSTPLRFLFTLAHVFFFLLAVSLVMWGVVNFAPDIWDTTASIWILGIVLTYLLGRTYGASLFGLFLWIVHKLRGPKAQANANQVFTGQSIADYKNLLRIHLARDGSLTIHALGVDKVCQTWDLADEAPGPRFEPRGDAPRVHAIDEPLRFDGSGNRVV